MANTKKRIDTLWDGFREAINAAYTEADKKRDNDGTCLRDYAENISWSDALGSLLARETTNERQHRRNRPSVSGFSVESAAKLILMEQARTGAAASEMPRATAFLVFRQSAVEAQVIGFLAKKHLPAEWRAAIAKLDYAKLMQPKQKSVTV
jgi:hypothetical protein